MGNKRGICIYILLISILLVCRSGASRGEEQNKSAQSGSVMHLNMPNIGAGIEQRDSNLHKAAVDGDLVSVKKYVASMGAPDIFNQYCYTPLMLAALHGHADVVQYLVDSGAYLDYVCGPMGYSALHLASYRGYVDVVNILVKAGADVGKTDALNETPLDLTRQALESDSTEKGRSRKGDLEKVIQILEGS